MSVPIPNKKQRALLRLLADGPLSQQELSNQTGRQSQAMASSLVILKANGWIESVDERDRSGPSTPARRWRLTSAGTGYLGQEPAAVAIGQGQPPTLFAHQGFVAATLSSQDVPRLMEALADRQASVDPQAVARLDGGGHAFLFLFDPELGSSPPEALAATLDAASVSFTIGTVADVRPWADFLADAQAVRLARSGAPKEVEPNRALDP